MSRKANSPLLPWSLRELRVRPSLNELWFWWAASLQFIVHLLAVPTNCKPSYRQWTHSSDEPWIQFTSVTLQSQWICSSDEPRIQFTSVTLQSPWAASASLTQWTTVLVSCKLTTHTCPCSFKKLQIWLSHILLHRNLEAHSICNHATATGNGSRLLVDRTAIKDDCLEVFAARVNWECESNCWDP